ncbi:hypothetical protein DXG03_004601 [Asterophora parasitica]|uniref:Cytochrome P450 n=1 Tax=Asterophora parasitica TaxID=117018 RepID=A0A9P7G8T1_9AGAR|nr:hypothetical protein DXG03_004601 [Asterophora parasitica]
MGEVLVFMHYGKEFRIQRRMVQQYFAKDKAKERQPIQLREARALAQSLLATPDRHKELMLRFSTAIVIEITFGHRIIADDDPYLKLADEFARSSTQTGPPGGTAVDLFPFSMVLYPEVQAMAQKELDTVVGTERLPEFHDRELLPYLGCLLLETLR